MSIQITPEALEVLSRSLELGSVNRVTGGVRLRGARTLGGGFDVQVELAAGPAEGDETVRSGDVNVFVDPALVAAMPDAYVTLSEEHERIVVLPRSPEDDGT